MDLSRPCPAYMILLLWSQRIMTAWSPGRHQCPIKDLEVLQMQHGEPLPEWFPCIHPRIPPVALAEGPLVFNEYPCLFFQLYPGSTQRTCTLT